MPPGPRRGGRVAQEFSTATMLTRSGPLGLQWKEVHRHQNEIKRQAAMRKTFSSQQVRGAGRAPHCTGKALSPRKYPFFSQHMRGSGTPRNGKALWPQKKGTLFFKRVPFFSAHGLGEVSSTGSCDPTAAHQAGGKAGFLALQNSAFLP